MRKANIYNNGDLAGKLVEHTFQKGYRFTYDNDYKGPPISLTMPQTAKMYLFESFPPVFEGLLPDGIQREMIIRRSKLERGDLYGLLLAVGGDMVGSITAGESYE